MAVQFPNAPFVFDPAEIGEEKVSVIPHYQDIHHLVAVEKQGTAPGCGVAIDSNTNEIYVAEGWLHFASVSIFSDTGVLLNSFSHNYMNQPWGIAIHRDNVYLTDIKEHSVFHFKVSADFRLVARLGGKGSGFGHFNEPRQLTVSTKGHVFVTDYLNHRVQILDGDLHYQRQITHHSMRNPRDVKLTSDLIYVLTNDTPSVHVFSHAGEKMRSLITRNYDFGKMVIDPYFFCLDAEENLIITDRGSHQIKIFSKEGAPLQSLGERGHEVGMFHYPCGIALTNNLKLVVVSYNNKCSLQLFSSNNY